MNIEKINDNQIKCTLNRADLLNYKLKISELAYGTDNAKALFAHMMNEAFEKFGFDAEDIPLMIEAVPLPPDCIVLLVTKITDSSKLNDNSFFETTRTLSAKPAKDNLSSTANTTESTTNNDNMYLDIDNSFPVLDAFEKVVSAYEDKKTNVKNKKLVNNKIIISIFSFTYLSTVIEACKTLKNIGQIVESNLYYSKTKDLYYLAIHNNSSLDFTYCNDVMHEFGSYYGNDESYEAFLKEHFKTVIKKAAIQSLSQL